MTEPVFGSGLCERFKKKKKRKKKKKKKKKKKLNATAENIMPLYRILISKITHFQIVG